MNQRMFILPICLLCALSIIACGKSVHPVDPTTPPAQTVCGNGTCDLGENRLNCPADCDPNQPRCGDHRCEGSEDQLTCPEDCGTDPMQKCGNLICEPGEDMLNCPLDCKN